MPLVGYEAADFGDDLAHGANVREVVERHGDVEVVLELAHQLEHEQRVVAEVRHQFAVGSGIDRLAAQSLQDVERVGGDPIVRCGEMRAARVGGRFRQGNKKVIQQRLIPTTVVLVWPARAGASRLVQLQSRSVTEQIVILAAGLGSRLEHADGGVPKPLLPIGGQPLIAHALAHADASGCREAIVVIGHEGRRVQAAVEALHSRLVVRFVETPDPTAPNGHSLLAAAPFAHPYCYLQMVDHVFSQPVLPRLDQGATAPNEAVRLLIDPLPDASIDLEDATKVVVRGSQIVAIGKGLARWDAIDTGCFRLTPAVFEALRQVPASEPLTVSAAMLRLARAGRMTAIEIGATEWADVDTPTDRAAAERLLALALPRQH